MKLSKHLQEEKEIEVEFWWRTSDRNSKVRETATVPKNISTKELDKMAEKMFWNNKEPDWGWKKL